MSIIWKYGIPLVGAIGVALLLATAQAGDRVGIVTNDDVVLSAGQKTLLQTSVNNIFGASVTANTLTMVVCGRRVVKESVFCYADDSATGTPTEYWAKIDAGMAGESLVDAGGGDYTWEGRFSNELLDGSATTDLKAFVVDVWPGMTIPVMRGFTCVRNGATVTFTGRDVQVKSESDAAALLAEGKWEDQGVVSP